MLARNTKVDMIKHVPLFERCSKKNLQQVASIADEIDVAAPAFRARGVPGTSSSS